MTGDERSAYVEAQQRIRQAITMAADGSLDEGVALLAAPPRLPPEMVYMMVLDTVRAAVEETGPAWLRARMAKFALIDDFFLSAPLPEER